MQYLMKNKKDEVDFLPADKRQRFPQIYHFRCVLGVN